MLLQAALELKDWKLRDWGEIGLRMGEEFFEVLKLRLG